MLQVSKVMSPVEKDLRNQASFNKKLKTHTRLVQLSIALSLANNAERAAFAVGPVKR
jgi:hypothetical protein